MDQNAWVKIRVNANPNLLEVLSPVFFELGCQGINELSDHFQLFFEQKDWTSDKKQQLLAILETYVVDGPAELKVEDVPSEDWTENWKKNFKPFRLGDKILIQPDWENLVPGEGETVITIAPKMAFGTGHHETTKLILQMLEKVVHPGMSVLDAGTGSAILAIYAAIKGANPVMAFDNDPLAIENALENCTLNNVTHVKAVCAELKDIKAEPYDLIVANINRNVLLDLAGPLKAYSKKTGWLILSGLLVTDREDILGKYRTQGWELLKEEMMGEWMALLLKNSDA
ncbi:MAG: 50S ribosomal protein L11 methyltransferase [Calditrichae bacterium]|nr:50S ribosomal protein L11 methyltransferase [Calditrichia bacterium]